MCRCGTLELAVNVSCSSILDHSLSLGRGVWLDRRDVDLLSGPVHSKRGSDSQHIALFVASFTLQRFVDIGLCLIDVAKEVVRRSVRSEYWRCTAGRKLVQLFVVVIRLVQRS